MDDDNIRAEVAEWAELKETLGRIRETLETSQFVIIRSVEDREAEKRCAALSLHRMGPEGICND